MKGLLLKDWYLAVKYARFFLLVTLLLLVLPVFTPVSNFLSIYPSILIATLPVTLLTYDDREGWLSYLSVTPLSRRLYVTEKYLCGFLIQALYLALTAALRLLYRREDLGELLATSFSIGLLTPALMLPLLFAFGAERGRMVYLVTVGVLFGVFFALTGTGVKASALGLPLGLVCLLFFALYVLSWRLSVFLFQRREL